MTAGLGGGPPEGNICFGRWLNLKGTGQTLVAKSYWGLVWWVLLSWIVRLEKEREKLGQQETKVIANGEGTMRAAKREDLCLVTT